MMTMNETLTIMTGYRELLVMERIAKGTRLNVEFDETIPTHLYTLANKMPYYIRYQAMNMRKWINCFDNDAEFTDVHGTDMLPLYVRGLDERNKFIWEDVNFNAWASFVEGKTVLDVGFGAGFYSSKFCDLNPGSNVYGVEKKDVAQFVLKYMNMPDNFKILDIDYVYDLGPIFDVIFFSEVFHGRSIAKITEMLDMYRGLLKPDGQIFINELWHNTPLGNLFSMNMLIHGKDGRLYTQKEMGRITQDAGYLAFTHKSTKYHWLLCCSKF